MIATAIFEIISSIETVLLAAGLANGETSESTETKTLFWLNSATSETTKKEYLVYSFDTIEKEYGDGEAIAYPFIVTVRYYVKSLDCEDELNAIEQQFLNNNYAYDFSRFDYDAQSQTYTFEFKASAMCEV